MGHTTIRRLLAPLAFFNLTRTKDKAGMSFKTLLAFIFLTLSLSVSAAPIQYTVTGEMAGTFTFDQTTNTYTDVSLIAPSPLGSLRWTLSQFTFVSNSFVLPVTTVSANSEQLVLTDAVMSQGSETSLSLAFDPLLSQSQPSQVSWSQTLGPVGTTYGTSSVIPPAPIVPDAPTIDSIAAGDGQVTVTFTPSGDGSVTGYRYIKDDGSITSTILGPTGANPFGIAVDASGNVYAANQNSYDVSKITPDGTSNFIGLTDGETRGIALDADGNVYTNNAIGTVSKITPDGVSIILGARDFTNSFGVVIDAAGNFYSANESADSVTKTTPDGTSSILGITGASPRWIALSETGNVYTPNYYSNNVSKITPDGTSTIVGVTGINPQGIALDAAGNIYTTDAGSATVSKITPDGISTTLGATGNNPDGIAIDAAGNVYTANSDDDSVSKITPDGISTLLGTTGNFPIKIALDAAGSVYTANSYSSNVSKITDASTATFAATGNTSPITITGLTNGTEYLISLIAVNAAGESVASNSVSVTPAPTAPVAPQITNIEPGNAQVSISVSVADDGGSPITGYTAYCFGDMFSFGSSPTSPIAVSGLTNGEAYECLVTATNAVGTSPLSLISASITPVAPPPGC